VTAGRKKSPAQTAGEFGAAPGGLGKRKQKNGREKSSKIGRETRMDVEEENVEEIGDEDDYDEDMLLIGQEEEDASSMMMGDTAGNGEDANGLSQQQLGMMKEQQQSGHTAEQVSK
jgi:hypothetical protein